ncbi:MAG TPA: hypothetical protein VNC50_06735 [Planctomycetia bacterium]|nr:hypothetical protein [Planctomycetia bacterium]
MSNSTDARPEQQSLDELAEKVARTDATVSGLLTAILFMAGVAGAFGIVWLLAADRLVITGPVQPPPGTVLPTDPPGAKGVSPDIGNQIELFDLELTRAAETTASEPAPDIMKEILDTVKSTDDAAAVLSGTKGDKVGHDAKGPDVGGDKWKPERAKRWVLEYGDSKTPRYRRMLDYFGIHLAAVRGERAEYAHRFAGGAGTKVAAPPSDLRFQALDAERRETDRGLLREAGVAVENAHIVQYFPKSLEEKLLAAELAHAKSQGKSGEGAILRTRFGVRDDGNGFTIVVLDQQYRP